MPAAFEEESTYALMLSDEDNKAAVAPDIVSLSRTPVTAPPVAKVSDVLATMVVPVMAAAERR